jgi:hypothetical protein
MTLTSISLALLSAKTARAPESGCHDYGELEDFLGTRRHTAATRVSLP